MQVALRQNTDEISFSTQITETQSKSRSRSADLSIESFLTLTEIDPVVQTVSGSPLFNAVRHVETSSVITSERPECDVTWSVNDVGG